MSRCSCCNTNTTSPLPGGCHSQVQRRSVWVSVQNHLQHLLKLSKCPVDRSKLWGSTRLALTCQSISLEVCLIPGVSVSVSLWVCVCKCVCEDRIKTISVYINTPGKHWAHGMCRYIKHNLTVVVFFVMMRGMLYLIMTRGDWLSFCFFQCVCVCVSRLGLCWIMEAQGFVPFPAAAVSPSVR